MQTNSIFLLINTLQDKNFQDKLYIPKNLEDNPINQWVNPSVTTILTIFRLNRHMTLNV
jgi:hypothetical protein